MSKEEIPASPEIGESSNEELPEMPNLDVGADVPEDEKQHGGARIYYPAGTPPEDYEYFRSL